MAACESCGMPLNDPQTVSKFDRRYCVYCQDQNTGALATSEQVREGSISAAVRLMGKTREEAKQMVDEVLPQLPRWRQG